MDTNKIAAEKIASEYIIKEESKLVALKKLDKKAKRGGRIFAYTFGSIMCLLFGTGMAICLKTDYVDSLYFVVGILCGIVGLIGTIINYFIYVKLVNKSKKKYAHDIITLAKEISEE